MVSGNEFNKLFARKLSEFKGTPEDLSDILERISKDNGWPYNINQFDRHIDPFNALAFCNRDLKIINNLKRSVGKEFGFDGEITEESAIPLVSNQLVSFVSRFQPERDTTVDKIWECFRTFIRYADGKANDDEFIEAFDYCTTVKGMVNDPHAQLTMGLYWIDSEFYVSLDSNVRQYVSDRESSISFKKVNGEKYLRLIESIHQFVIDQGLESMNHLSRVAYDKDKTNYWQYVDFDSEITTEMWLALIHDDSVFSDNRLSIIRTFYDNDNGLTCAEADEEAGKNRNTHKKVCEDLAESIQKKTDCRYTDDENAKYWPILFIGRKLSSEEKRNGRKGHYIWKLRDELRSALDSIFKENDKISNKDECDFDKNTILYGPPGTGKTYHTYRMAVEIIEGKKNDDFNFKEEFDRLYDAGQIRFITFHQSYSYEEFIEGIRPIVDDDNSSLGYELKDGVFKEFCRSAENKAIVSTHGMSDDPKVWKVSLEGTNENDTRTECLKNGHIRIGWDEYGEVISEDTKYDNGGKSVLNAFINKMQIGDIVLSCFSSKTIDAIGVVKGDYRWNEAFPKYRRVRDVEWIKKFDNPPDIVSINSGKTMTLSTVYQMNVSKSNVLKLLGEKTSVKTNDKRYVFIIDEINRGNVSRIFGELITLIEEPKRLGGDEALEINLPYSGERFGVPSNVYIIGTMNTTDRSLVALDSALRRRFSFVEMLPNYDIINPQMCGNIDLRKLLETINARIKSKYDREHMIGHSYLMNIHSIGDLSKAFRKKIIPLIQEYFYDDEKKMISILRSEGSESSPFISSDNAVIIDNLLIEDSYIRIYKEHKSENGNDNSN